MKLEEDYYYDIFISIIHITMKSKKRYTQSFGKVFYCNFIIKYFKLNIKAKKIL